MINNGTGKHNLTLRRLTSNFTYQGIVEINEKDQISINNNNNVGQITCKLTSKVSKLPVSFLKINGNFLCNGSGLVTLANSPQIVTLSFRCQNNQLSSLENSPHVVGEAFECANNKITSLDGVPSTIDGSFSCKHNLLHSLIGAEHTLFGSSFDCSFNKLTSLDGLPKSINGEFRLDYIPNLPMLRLFKVRGITEIRVKDPADDDWGHPVEHIINRYIHLGINGILPCAAELYKAGYSGNAKL